MKVGIVTYKSTAIRGSVFRGGLAECLSTAARTRDFVLKWTRFSNAVLRDGFRYCSGKGAVYNQQKCENQFHFTSVFVIYVLQKVSEKERWEHTVFVFLYRRIN